VNVYCIKIELRNDLSWARKTTECIKRLGLDGVILSVHDCMKTFY
jgi:hypothetical protein